MRAVATFAALLLAPPAASGAAGAVDGLTWDDTRDDKRGDQQLTTRVRFASSQDGGERWTPADVAPPFDALSASETSSTKVAGHFLGDYQAAHFAQPGRRRAHASRRGLRSADATITVAGRTRARAAVDTR